jgi:SNF family Na+-dependent transporter
MIQRIQTIYLLLAAIAMALTLHFPLGTIVAGGDEIILNAFDVSIAGESVQATWLYTCLVVMLALPALLSVIIIFLYKNRLLQLRLCVSNIVLHLGALACIAVFCWRMSVGISALAQYQEVQRVFTLGWVSVMPVISIILVALAIRGISKDEALVRSLDRIR